MCRNRVGGGHGGGNTCIVYFGDGIPDVMGVVWINAGVTGVDGDVERVTGVVGINAGVTGVYGDVERVTGVVGINAGVTGVDGDVERFTGVMGINAGVTGVEGEGIADIEGKSSLASGKKVSRVSHRVRSTSLSGLPSHSYA